jgi:non-ribosomal peptide synthetase component F
MPYTLKLYEADVSPEELREAELRFRSALEETLGSPELVIPVYRAYQRLIGAYGEAPDIDNLTDAERLVLDQWQAAELAAVTAAFGPNRYMGDAMYELGITA